MHENRTFNSRIEAEEYRLLIEDMKLKNFKYAAEISKYIVDNKLGYKYQNISGYLTMENSYTEWIFEGGFPSKIFAWICIDLGVHDKNTEAKVKSFKSFAQSDLFDTESTSTSQKKKNKFSLSTNDSKNDLPF